MLKKIPVLALLPILLLATMLLFTAKPSAINAFAEVESVLDLTDSGDSINDSEAGLDGNAGQEDLITSAQSSDTHTLLNSEWDGNWDSDYDGYNCYSYAIGKKTRINSEDTAWDRYPGLYSGVPNYCENKTIQS